MMDCQDGWDGGCRNCGGPLPPRRSQWCSSRCMAQYRKNHRWTNARAEAKRKAQMWLCARCGYATDRVQVNHIKPCKGKHGLWGCWHHQDNLEVLCIPCHKEVTAEQRKEGLL